MLIRAGLGALAAVVATTVGAIAPAHADTTVTVRGTAFPDASVQLALVGCASLFERADEPLQARIGRGTQLQVAGQRALGYDLAGGNAMGSVFSVGSLTSTRAASLAAFAPAGATGVAYAGYRSPLDAGTDRVWFGRAPLAAPAGQWHNVDATLLSYVWTQYDMATGRVVRPADDAAPSNIFEFTAAHGGDGPGLFTIGYGCDGRPFQMDALRSGAAGDITTYDVEGLVTSTEIRGSRRTVVAGGSVTLTGALHVASGKVPHPTLVLEERAAGTDLWWPVGVVDADSAQLTVTPQRRTAYRWRFVDRPLAEGSESAPFVVDVLPAQESAPPRGGDAPPDPEVPGTLR